MFPVPEEQTFLRVFTIKKKRIFIYKIIILMYITKLTPETWCVEEGPGVNALFMCLLSFKAHLHWWLCLAWCEKPEILLTDDGYIKISGEVMVGVDGIVGCVRGTKLLTVPSPQKHHWTYDSNMFPSGEYVARLWIKVECHNCVQFKCWQHRQMTLRKLNFPDRL